MLFKTYAQIPKYHPTENALPKILEIDGNYDPSIISCLGYKEYNSN